MKTIIVTQSGEKAHQLHFDGAESLEKMVGDTIEGETEVVYLPALNDCAGLIGLDESVVGVIIPCGKFDRDTAEELEGRLDGEIPVPVFRAYALDPCRGYDAEYHQEVGRGTVQECLSYWLTNEVRDHQRLTVDS